MPTPLRTAFLDAAGFADALLRDPAVAAAWGTPSALEEFRVSGLAGHLAAQIVFVPPVLAEPVPDAEPIALIDHYTRSSWVDADLHDEVNVGIRQRSDDLAEVGPDELVRKTEKCVDELRAALAAEPADRVIHLSGRWSLTLDDYLVARLVEIAVHSDDLAVSVDIATPDLPPEVLDPVLGILAKLAAHKHGQPAVLRALSRAERAPTSITAL